MTNVTKAATQSSSKPTHPLLSKDAVARWGAVFILLSGFALMVYNLTEVPPGLTHDEANHGNEAIEVLQGIYRYYFPLGYGREPLYAYLLAGFMRLVSVSPFTLRLLIPYIMLIGIAAMWRWTARRFGSQTAWLTAAVWIVSFWPLVSSRQALRSGLMPLLMVILSWSFWQIWRNPKEKWGDRLQQNIWPITGIALSIGLMLHTYIAARVSWLVVPVFMGYALLFQRDRFKKTWLPTLTGLVLGGLLAAPLFIYLQQNPGLETRLEMLDGPLTALQNGNPLPLANNMWKATIGLIWPGAGDKFLAYNIPGRPTLHPITAVLAVIGFFVSLWRARNTPLYVYIIFWLGIGLAPSLITGATANTTRNMAALPVLYLLPAIGLVACWQALLKSLAKQSRQIALGGISLVWLTAVLWGTVNDYFVTWAQQADVRAAYQRTIMAAVDDAKSEFSPADDLMFSSVYPGLAHDATIAQVQTGEPVPEWRWMDGRFGLLFPADTEMATLYAPSSAELHPLFQTWQAASAEQTDLVASDLDPHYKKYSLTRPTISTTEPIANFNDALHLMDAYWLADSVSPNGVGEFVTIWQVVDPDRVGPKVWPLEATDVVFFTQVLTAEGAVLTQADRTDAPSWSWQGGDIVVQVHQMYVPGETAVGEYQTIVGVYDQQSGARLTISGSQTSFIDTSSLHVRE